MKSKIEDKEYKEFLNQKNKEGVSKYDNLVKKFQDYSKYKNLMKEHKKYLEFLDKKRTKHHKKLKIDDTEKSVKLNKQLTDLKETSQIKVNEFISEQSFLKRIDRLKWYNWIKKIKRKLKRHVLVVIHRPDNYDIARYIPLEKGHILDIDGNKHLFNPKHFRYINGVPILYFYWGNPFAKIMSVSDGYSEPTISSEAFSSVLTSKFVIDAVKGEDTKVGIIWNIIIIIILVIVLVMSFINTVGMSQVSKALGG